MLIKRSDLEKADIAQLKDLLGNVHEVLQFKLDYQHRLEQAREQLSSVAKELDVDVNDLIGVKQKKKPTRRPTQTVVHPDDPTRVWPGRGRKPDWVKALENQEPAVGTRDDETNENPVQPVQSTAANY